MLLLYLQEYNPHSLSELSKLCRDSFKLDWEARVEACAETPDALLETVKHKDIPAMFIMEDSMRERLNQAVSQIREQNALNYLVLQISSALDALHVRPPFYRASGFLLKPIDKDALHQLLDGIYRDFSATRKQYGGFFSPKIRGTVYHVPYDKILFFESGGKKIICRTSAQEYEFYNSLEEISRNVPEFFLRTHRSFCVNTRQISSVSLAERIVTMTDGSVIPFSRTFKSELAKAMEGLSVPCS